MNKDSQILSRCFEQLADTDTDIAPAVYARFTTAMPEALQHIGYLDERMKGRMLDQVYQLLLGETDDNYLAFEAKMHKGYGANTALYRGLLSAVRDTVKDALAASWSAQEDAAWDASINRIVGDIERLDATH